MNNYIEISIGLSFMLFLVLYLFFVMITDNVSIIKASTNKIFIIILIIISAFFISRYNSQKIYLQSIENKRMKRDVLFQKSDKIFEIITIGLDDFIDIANEDIPRNKDLLISQREYVSKAILRIEPFIIEDKELVNIKNMMLYYEDKNKIPVISTDGRKLGLIYNPNNELLTQIDESMSITNKDIKDEKRHLAINKYGTITFIILTGIVFCINIIVFILYFDKYENKNILN